MKFRFLLIIFFNWALMASNAFIYASTPFSFENILKNTESISTKKEKQSDEIPQDIQDFISLLENISILENPTKRQQLIDHLKKIHKVEEPGIGSFKRFTKHLTSYVKHSATVLFKAAQTLASFPQTIKDTITTIDDEQLKNVKIFFFIFFIAWLIGYIVEKILKRLMKHFYHDIESPLTLVGFSISLVALLIPLLGFAVLGMISVIYLCEFFPINPEVSETLSHALLFIVGLISIVRLLWKFFKLLLQPNNQELRLIPIDDKKAHRLYRIIIVLGQILLVGGIIEKLLVLINVEPTVQTTWENIVASFLFLTLASLIIEYKKPIAAWIRQEENGLEGTPRFFMSLMMLVARIWHILALLAFFVIYLSWVFDAFGSIFFLIKSVVLTVTVVALLRYFTSLLSKTGKNWIKQWEQTPYAFLQKVYFFVPVGQFLLYIIAFMSLLIIWGLDLFTLSKNIEHIALKSLSVLLVVVVIALFWSMIDLFVQYQLQTVKTEDQMIEPSLFSKTILPIARSTFKGLIGVLGGLIILSTLGIEIMPIVYAFSVVGLAFSFGAQTLMKDVITGCITLFEGNVAVGEIVTIGAHTGMVEAISLRSIYLRHVNGAIQTIPFSEVTNIINKSRDYTLHRLEIAVSHMTSTEKVYHLIQKTYKELKNDEKWKDKIITDLSFAGIDRFSDTALYLLATVKTIPDPKSEFLRDFYARLQKYMQKANIMPPVSHQIIHERIFEDEDPEFLAKAM
jgi:small conductance mechanosensitive channel